MRTLLCGFLGILGGALFALVLEQAILPVPQMGGGEGRGMRTIFEFMLPGAFLGGIVGMILSAVLPKSGGPHPPSGTGQDS